MLFRALFWLTVVAVFTPHQPNLGLGRPGSASDSLIRETRDTVSASLAQADCKTPSATCADTLSFLDGFRFAAGRSLAEVKAELARAPHGSGDD